jgi:hypothetical protein
MDTFTIILISVCIIFILYYYYKQYKNWKNHQDKLTWPQDYNNCPDYWEHKGHHICKNVNNLGKCPKNYKGALNHGNIDFKKVLGVENTNNRIVLDKRMKKHKNLIKKCHWAKQCNASWEGVDKLCA